MLGLLPLDVDALGGEGAAAVADVADQLPAIVQEASSFRVLERPSDLRYTLQTRPNDGYRATSYPPLQAGLGAFAVVGQSAALEVSRLLAAEAGIFALTGRAATLSKGKAPLQAGAGSFVLSGQAAGFAMIRILHSSAGAYAVTGHDADLRSTTAVSAGTPTFARRRLLRGSWAIQKDAA